MNHNGEQISTERIKELTMAKVRAAAPVRKARFSKRFAVIFIAAVLALAVTVIAASVGSFDRLRGVVGEDMAAFLHPVEIVTGEYSYDGVRIEVVAVGVFANVVDVYITLEDLTDQDRFDGEVQVWAIVSCVYDMGGSIGTVSQVIDRCERGTVTLHSRQYFMHSVVGNELFFQLMQIRYNVELADGTCEDGIIGMLDWDVMDIRWYFPFYIDAEETPQAALVAKDLNICFGNATLMKVTVSPFTVLLEIHGEERRTPSITINTTEGVFAQTRYCLKSVAMIFPQNDFSAAPTGNYVLWEIPTDFLDIDTVVSIEVGGEIIFFVIYLSYTCN
ncbi:MAG: hypothetical protein FWB96_00025 [Defluviitaleaceae bacterium]|nr:hypothetical protein [Defluviitaleaceae bacterium]MCL2262570.1 hypothetical protein [Defluviitaleaceae bacterium]